MFKAARNHLVTSGVLSDLDAPYHFIERLLYNVLNGLFSQPLIATHVDILQWLARAHCRDFVTQSGNMKLFGPRQEQWNPERARRFVSFLRQLWEGWH